jgi:uncharacterized FAD-dependent dehydrogenase
MKIYDLIIVGSGPAGVMAAKKASEYGMSILMLEKGRDLFRRRDLTAGWFGQGLFKMDHLELKDPILKNTKAINEVFNLIKKLYGKKIKILTHSKNKYCKLDSHFGMTLALYFFKSLVSTVDIIFNTEVLKIEFINKCFIAHTTGNKFKGKRCLVATGKNSIDWINFLCKSFNLKPVKNSIKIGVRVEVPTFRIRNVLEEREYIKDGYFEDTRINSFVGEWEESNMLSAFGYNLPKKKSSRTNFMVGIEPDETIYNIIREIQIVNVLANDKIKRERIIDYMKGRSILKYIKTFDQLYQVFNNIENYIPSFINYATMYIPEVRLKGAFPVNPSMSTKISGLYGAGECTSRVNTLIGAMASGLIAIKTISKE